MKFLILFIVALLNITAIEHSKAEEQASLKLGLLPHLSTTLLFKKYKPLISYLENHLQVKIDAKTAPDFKTYIQRVSSGSYDLYITAPHLALYHKQTDNHHVLSRFAAELNAVYTVSTNSNFKTLGELKGKTLATPDSLAVIAMLGEVHLAEQDFDIINNLTIKRAKSHNNAMVLVSLEHADFAVVGISAFKIANKKLKPPLRIIGKTEFIPHMMFLANDKIADDQIEKIRSALLNFTAAGAGKSFFNSTPFKDMIPVSDKDYQRLEPFIPLLKQRLN